MILFHSWRKTNSIVKGVIESKLCHYQVPALPTRGQTPEAKKLQSSSLQNQVQKCRSEPALEPPGPWPFGDKRGVYCWDTEDIPHGGHFSKVKKHN